MLRYFSGPPAERVKLTPRSFSVVLAQTRGPRLCISWDRNGLRSHPKHAKSHSATVQVPLSRSRIDPSISQTPLLATEEKPSSEMGLSVAKPMPAEVDKIDEDVPKTPASTTLPSVPVDFQSREDIHFGTNEDPSNKIVNDVLKCTALELRRHILELLPGASHPVSQAANHFLVLCTMQAMTGMWWAGEKGFTSHIITMKSYITENWIWSQIWTSHFRESFEKLVKRREKLLVVGLSSLLRRITLARESIWPVESGLAANRDQTMQFIDKFWGLDKLMEGLTESLNLW